MGLHDHGVKDSMKVVEAVGIEPYCRRYANPTRTLGFLAYRFERRAARPLTPVPSGTLESPRLPWALVTIWSLTNSAPGEREQWRRYSAGFTDWRPLVKGPRQHVAWQLTKALAKLDREPPKVAEAVLHRDGGNCSVERSRSA